VLNHGFYMRKTLPNSIEALTLLHQYLAWEMRIGVSSRCLGLVLTAPHATDYSHIFNFHIVPDFISRMHLSRKQGSLLSCSNIPHFFGFFGSNVNLNRAGFGCIVN
jgi:hypothetical protein